MLDFEKEQVYSLMKEVSKTGNNELEEVFIEALERKGFYFNTRAELMFFLKEHVTCVDYKDTKQRVYKIDNNPFFLHFYETSFNLSNGVMGELTTVSFSKGSYKFL